MESLLRSVYRPYRTLSDLLESLVRAFVRQLGLGSASLRLRGVGVLQLNRSGEQFDLAWLEEANVDAHTAPAAHSARFPVTYAGEQLGTLRLNGRGAADRSDAFAERGAAFAYRCALLCKRYDVQRWAQQRLSRSLLLVGVSEPLHHVEVFVEKASYSTLPVLLTGEFGTEKALLAAALHCCGPRRDGPFVEVNCADPAGEPAQWFKQAAGGTLFFNGIDELAPRLQNQLRQHLHSRLGQWLVVPDECEVRVVASTTSDLRRCVEEGRFSQALLAELDFLSVTVPSLRLRPDDIAPLIVAALEHHGYVAERKCSDALLEICRLYAWPENLYELERVIARLAVMTGDAAIGRADVALHVPWVISQPRSERVGATRVADRDDETSRRTMAPDVATLRSSAMPAHWARCAMTRNGAELARLHKALRRALLYLGEHYANPISMEQLAQHAHVSPSHLSYLFRHTLNVAFKPLLQQIRIEKAKEMLMRDDCPRVTEVALSVGFGDLSHFEKSFRRIVGLSPREFRSSVA
ncbi:helix-turn-helix domain-containing protein [Burkholderia oklahomensis]|uniref:helix-turn-helix domain-containing protein n=1 Tax=Burkholderia oklahomensis TaxID=342113 RepID=UPI00016AA190|nr:helix-turn-helix domain-containing protein [Burkholderia oklahomensis]AJX33042.1 sigma-54 interaction domain protein [Burkholderia oklahomensis C6786]AOI47435.1 transcriptional regulator [Burkholderia oklahomensis C6786]KUY61796.1 transcriptional regulator [Burkholderia oklahomensis C6786]MBI0359845.1 helix-turn-helix domain-containing protein [Burkholderia oklahomensis]SUW59228.1 Transcriptional regulatory protein tyrR [Burkholderia oklahomensis]